MTEYYGHSCKCGCGELIEIKPWHKWNGIPNYIDGHHRTGKKNSEKSNRKNSESQKGKYNHRWIGGCADYWARELKKIYKECVLCKSKRLSEIHHKDHNRKNNKRKNLIIICVNCHKFWHQTNRGIK